MDANEFRERMAQLPEPITDQKPPYWEYWRWELWHLAQTQDVAKFWEWPAVYHTMLVQHWIEAMTYEWRELNRDRFKYLDATLKLSETDFRALFFISPLINNLIHQAYHLQQWERTARQVIDELDTIVEFGGGYGAMCLLCHKLGFRGRYIIYDLPEFSLLQQYYLDQHGIKPEWNPRRKPKDVDLFIALYSLSEVEPELREDSFLDSAKSCLLLYSGQWEAWDNVAYFQKRPSTKQWIHTEITHLPDCCNFYSVGF